MGSSIFTRSSSHISPFTFNVDTPCYQNCWVAPTANECFTHLQMMPPQIQVATALKKIRSARSQEIYLFDSSDCGMLEIIMSKTTISRFCFTFADVSNLGLHVILYRAMEESLDHENNICNSPTSEIPVSTPASLSKLLRHDLLNHHIVKITNDLVDRQGSDAMKRANAALDAWHRNWDLRKSRDIYGERNSAFSHPLNFWLLAKIFIVLHFFRNHPSIISNNQQQQDTEFFAFFDTNDGTASKRIAVQLQVIDWLSRIRHRREREPLSAESFLSQVFNLE